MLNETILLPDRSKSAEQAKAETTTTGALTRVYSGVLKWFDITRGFGFLVADDPTVGDIPFIFRCCARTGGAAFPKARVWNAWRLCEIVDCRPSRFFRSI